MSRVKKRLFFLFFLGLASCSGPHVRQTLDMDGARDRLIRFDEVKILQLPDSQRIVTDKTNKFIFFWQSWTF